MPEELQSEWRQWQHASFPIHGSDSSTSGLHLGAPSSAKALCKASVSHLRSVSPEQREFASANASSSTFLTSLEAAARPQAPFECGDVVQLIGLQNAAFLNGTFATVDHQDATGRWKVFLEGSREIKSVRTENLQRAPPGTRVSREAADEDAEDATRRARMQRSRAEAARRASVPERVQGAEPGWGNPDSDLFAVRADAQPSMPQAVICAGPTKRLPCHQDCEAAVQAMISRTQDGMRTGLRLFGLPDEPLEFVPGLSLKLCGKELRPQINDVIGHWMEENQISFWKALGSLRLSLLRPEGSAPDGSEAELLEWPQP